MFISHTVLIPYLLLTLGLIIFLLLRLETYKQRETTSDAVQHKSNMDRKLRVEERKAEIIVSDATQFKSNVDRELRIEERKVEIIESDAVLKKEIAERKKVEGQLLQSQKMETVGTLAGGIAHDLNNQLTPVRGYLDLILQQTGSNSPDYSYLLEASQAATRCTEVIGRLMNFSRSSSQEKNLLSVQAILEEVKTLLSKFLSKSILVKVAYPADIWPVFGNDTEIDTIFMNLAANARDAMREGGDLSIEAQNIQIHGPHVVFSVKDSGGGMPESVMDKIFEPFFTTKEKGEGTGLGLAMVFKIVKDHQGWIEVSSVIGKGTCFQIYMPAKPGAQVPLKETQKGLIPPNLLGHGEKILFVEDEESIRNMGRAFLERLGYEVLLACDGQEAFKIYQEKPTEVDAVIMDMAMPKQGGKITLMKMIELNPSVKIILASGYTSDGLPQDLIKLGAVAFLHKPYTVVPLARILKKILP